MIKLEELLETIAQSESVQRFKELDAALATNEYFNETMKRLKELQRQIVMAKSSNTDYIPYEVEFNALMSKFMENPTIAEYLELKHHLQGLLHDVQKIFNTELK